MDENNEKSQTIDLNESKSQISTHTSRTEVKKDNINQVVKSCREPPTKSFSCTELPGYYLKSSSCTDIDGKALFFNEKGWPVKVMRLTEDSPPKSVKPWPTRSVPATSLKKSPRKEKSLLTNKKPAAVQKSVRMNPKSSKEDKENNKTEPSKEIEIKSKISEEQPVQKEKKVEEKKNKDALDTNLKLMLEKLDNTMDKLTSGNDPSADKESTSAGTKIKETAVNSRTTSTLERKTPHNDIKKENIIHSARSNKYNSKEVKAYMQAKRLERKMQMSEETRKRQDMLEMQKKNLEKLKEKALQVLKKSSAKAADENKPKWQGPLEEDNSEVLPPAIHIFESKIPTARKSKTCIKPDESSNETNADKESTTEKLSSKQPEGDLQKSEEIPAIQHSIKNKNMEFKKPQNGLKNSRNKLRLSITKPSGESSPVKIGMEAAAMEVVPRLQMEMDSARKSFESQNVSPKSSKEWNLHNLTFETNEIPNPPDNSRRTTFICTPRESNLPMIEEPPAFEPNPKFSHMDVPPLSSHRKRHHLSPTKTNNLTPKKLCVNSSEGVLNNKVSNSMEDQLRRIREEISQKQKEDKEPDKLLTHIKPDGFSVMNVMKMKLLANENKYLGKTNITFAKGSQQPKIITTKNSFDDDTDAPSIISMEEDFGAQPEPLRLSDLQLKLDASGQTSFASQLSPVTSKTSLSSRRNGVESLKSSSISSFALDAPPLVIPESVQNLKLSSNRSLNDFSYPSNKAPNSSSADVLDLKLSSYSYSTKSFQEKPSSLSQTTSSVNKTSQSRYSNKQNPQEEYNQSESHSEDPQKEIQTIQGSNPAALFLQFHAELSRLDAFDQSLAQVIAAERLHSVSGHLHTCGRHSLVSRDRNSRRSSQYSAVFEQPSSEPKASPVSDEGSGRTVTSQHDRLSGSRSASSVVEQTSHGLDITQSDVKEVPQKLSPHLSFSSSIPLSFSPKSIHILQVLIDDAQFQRKQLELMYKTQEDILLSQYKAELSEVDIRYRSNGQLTNIGVETKRIVDEKYRTPLAKLKERRDQALANSDARIEYLSKQIRWLNKQKKSKTSKLRSAEASPKKLTPLRSISLTSVVENSSSSESSAGLQTLDDRKKQEIDRDKSSSSSRRKIEKEMLWRLQEELAKVKELQKADRFLKSNRSRRDKSTSPLESVPETSTKDAACSVNEDDENASLQVTSSLRTVEEARSTDMYNSESFESPESSETPRQPNSVSRIPLSSKPLMQARPSNKSRVLIKVPLSPRVQVRSKRRGSSGSDESLLLSQNETQSEQSDYEVRISALKEQKRQRFAELNRLERELKRAQREQLKATEAALVKQIQAYELKIVQTKKQLEEVTSTNIVRPQIKHPRVSDKFFPRTSDVFQKSQTVEEPPKQQEQNASDLDTNSLKSISEASSTETTIQSSGKVQATEPRSKSSIDIENDNKDVSSAGSEVTEAPSSVATEEPTVLDTQKSVESEVQDQSDSTVKSVSSEPANQSNDSVNWMDAEEFFSQMGTEKSLSNESRESKVSPNKSVSSGSHETIVSEELSAEVQKESKVSSASQASRDAEDITASPKTATSLSPATPKTASSLSPNSTAKLESESKESEEEPSLETASPEKDDQLDEGNVVSVVSHSPSNKSPKSVSEIQSSSSTELNSGSHFSLLSLKQESDVPQCDGDVNVSVVISEKSDVSEVPSKSAEASVATDSNLTSQCSSAEEGSNSNAPSDVDDSYDSSQSDVIKVFVSNKTLDNEEQASNDNNNVHLNETYLVSEAESKHEDESVVDNITDKILQNLLNECLECKKDDQAVRVSENIPKFVESGESTPPADVESKAESLVNDFAQTVLNKFLKDATDCMLKIKDAKKTAHLNSINLNLNIELHDSDSPSNKLLEALALERKSISSEKGREENTPSPKSTRSSNNEVELSEGNDSEVFWFDEDLAPVSLQTQREAEELRLKQLQIEREIEQIKKLEAESIPYYCLRQIPNKPPPPYTPPGQSVQAKDLRPVPTKREDVERLVATATRELAAAWRRGDDLSAVEPAEDSHANHAYNKFLFDLVKQLFISATTRESDEKNLPPWERTGCRMKRLVLPKPTEESVSEFVMKKVRVLFGFEPDSIKENLIIQWSRKKRDKVDELLVRESQEEERDWTDYSKCEVAVKNNVALTIFDNLVEETGQALSRALQKKLAYCQQST